MRAWTATNTDSALPIQFLLAGQPFSELVPDWGVTRTRAPSTGEGATGESIVYNDPATGLTVELELKQYNDFAAVEWMVRLRNDGATTSPAISDVDAINAAFPRQGNEVPVLFRHRGSHARRLDFAPIRYEPTNWLDKKPSPYWVVGEPLHGDQGAQFGSAGGRSSNGHLPFYEVSTPSYGISVAIGWSGQWVTDIALEGDDTFRVRAGMDGIDLRLEPGESIRSPRILVLFWDHPREHAHNLLRRLMLRHHTPHIDGKPVTLPVAASTFAFFPEVTISTVSETMGTHVNEANQLEMLAAYVDKDLPIEVFWIDAGWYDNDGSWRRGVGNWYPNPTAFPRGLRPISDAAHRAGKRLLVWLEPERVYVGTRIHREHPEWLLRRAGEDDNFLYDLGNESAREWLIAEVSKLIHQQGIDILRHDFNMDPLAFWTEADVPSRRGMTEIRYIEGLYKFWDELRALHPQLLIDNCASGGRRIDLESSSRTVPLTRSDYPFLKVAEPGSDVLERYEPTGLQAQTWGINHFLPLTGTSTNRTDKYGYRSAMSSGGHIAWDPRAANFPVEEARSLLVEHLAVREFFSADFYPLTAYGVGQDTWMAFQFHDEGACAGIVLAFRRSESPYPRAEFALRGVNPDRTYDVQFGAEAECQPVPGKRLAHTTLDIDVPRESVLMIYREQAQS